MPKTRRNDPCPCGSGKKHKNCCMRRDQFRTSRQLSLSDGEAFLLNRLYDYARSPRLASDLTQAFALYWGGQYDLEGVSEFDPDDLRRMFEWFLYDYRTSSDDRYVIDLYIETEARDYPPELKEILAAWSASVSGLFRVLERGSGRLRLLDRLHSAELEIRDAFLSRNAERGDLLIGRLYELDGAQRLSHMTMMLPQAYEEGLAAYVINAYNRYVEGHYQAGWSEFLREFGYIFNAYLLSPKALPLRSQVGPGTRYHDPAAARDRLRESTDRRAAERQQEPRERQTNRPPEHRTASGIVLPGAPPAEAAPSSPGDQAPVRPTILIPGRDS